MICTKNKKFSIPVYTLLFFFLATETGHCLLINGGTQPSPYNITGGILSVTFENNPEIVNINTGGAINGAVSVTTNGFGTVNTNISYADTNTTFGASGLSIGTLNIANTNTLTLTKDTYTNSLVLSGATATLNLNTGAKTYGIVRGNTNGDGIININANYNTNLSPTDTERTTFGTSGNSIGTLNIATATTLILDNIAYINALNTGGTSTLDVRHDGTVNGVINLTSSNDIIGTVQGSGTTLNISGRDYSDTTTAFGRTGGNNLNELNLENARTLTLSNQTAYVTNLDLVGATSTLTMDGSGAVEGTIRGNGGTFGVVNINKNYNNPNTIFGTSGNLIDELNIGAGNTLILVNTAYIEDLNVTGTSTLALGTTGIVNGIINLNSDGTITGEVKGSGTTFDIDNDYNDTNLTLGTGGAGGISLNELNIENTRTLTLSNRTAYVTNLDLVGTTSTLTIDGSGAVEGTIRGNGGTFGIVNIDKDYDNTLTANTTFGTSGNTINALNIQNNHVLTLSGSNDVYANITTDTNATGSLIINNNITINGTIGASGTALNNIGISDTKTLTLTDDTYVTNDITLTGTTSALNLDSSADVYGTIKGATSGDGIVNINTGYNDTNTTFGTSGNTIGTANLTGANTLTLANTAYIDQFNITSTSILALGTTGIVNGIIDLSSSSDITGEVKGSGTTLNINRAAYTDGTTILGTSGTSLKELNVIAGNALTLSNRTAYITDLDLGAGSTLTISGSGASEGIIKGDANGQGIVNINEDYSNANTTFGINGNAINTMNIAVNKILTLGNTAYINTLNINDGSILELGTTGEVNGTIDLKADGDITGTVKGASTILNLNRSYDDTGVTFGTSSEYLGTLNIGTSRTLSLNTIGNTAYVTTLNMNANNATLDLSSNGTLYGNLNVTNNTSTLNLGTTGTVNGTITLSSNNDIIGTVKGSGTTLNINRATYTDTTTILGTSGTSLKELNVLTGNTLTLSNRTAYVTDLDLVGTLTINGSGAVQGTIKGENDGNGTIDLDRNYNNTTTTNTTFGTSGNAIGTLNVLTTRNLTLQNTSYVNSITLADNSTLDLSTGSGGTVIGDVDVDGTSAVLTLGTVGSVNGKVDLNAGSINGTLKGTGTTVNVKRNYNESITTFGQAGGGGNSLGALNISSGYTLTIDSGNVYANTITFQELGGTGSTLVTSDTGTTGVAREITGNMEAGTDGFGLFDVDTDTVFNGSIGTTDKRLAKIDMGEANIKMTLKSITGNSTEEKSYVDEIDFTGGYTDATNKTILEINGDSDGYLVEGKIVYPSTGYLGTIVSLGGDIIEGGQTQAEALGSLIGDTYIEGTTNALIKNNILYFNVVDLSTLVTVGNTVDIVTDPTKDFTTQYSDRTVTYDSIFRKLSLQAKSGDNTTLQILVEETRNIDNGEISQAGKTTGYLIDGWQYEEMDADESAIVRNIQRLSTEEEFLSALSDLSPDVSGAIIKTSFQTVNNSTINIRSRLDKVRSKTLAKNEYSEESIFDGVLYASAETRFRNPYYSYDSYGENSYKKPGEKKVMSLWTEVFGRNIKADNKGYIDGYKASTYGITLGYDQFIKQNTILGTSYTFSYSDVNSTPQLTRSEDDLNVMSHNIDLYSTIYDENTYFDFVLGGTIHEYDGARKINFGSYNKIAKSDYNGYGISALFGSGYNLKIYTKKREKIYMDQVYTKQKRGEVDRYKVVMNDIDDSIIITPNFSLLYSGLKIDDYVEKEAGSSSLEVKTKNSHKFEAEAGVRFLQNSTLRNKLVLQKMLSLGVSYDLINDKPKMRARFINDDDEFMVYGYEPEPILCKTGIGVLVKKSNNLNLGVQYNYDFNEDIQSHTLKFDALLRF
ncbi:autotransporter domain-containing protein [Pseudomonadota bacterium]